jgi:co-chaperonin GroES (HSP10)
VGKILGKAAYDAQDPRKLRPHGDRLLVEKYEVEDAVFVTMDDGTQKKIRIQRERKPPNPRDPSPEFTSEQLQEIARGWILCEVIRVGNGHRLELDMVVPMPFEPGDFVYVERLTGREWELRGAKYYIISQTDVLCFADDVTKQVKEDRKNSDRHLAAVN